MRTMVLKCVPFFLAVLLVNGCAHYPRNAPLTSIDPSTGYRLQKTTSPTNSSDLLLMLAFSGGGTRAASLSYGVLEQLARTPVGLEGTQCRMLDEVDIISSVSGGSFTSAYYALCGDRIFSDFESRFLKKHVQTSLLLRTLTPWNQIRLASPNFSRSDLAAEYYDHLLFKGATFADLQPKAGRPFLSVNATDLGSGARFEFTQDEFDLLHSDLSRFPISRAVAASSAFPVYLTPIVLKNYSAEQSQPEPQWIQAIKQNPMSPSRLRYVASQAASYSDGHRHFIHLLDGGLSDNLGLRGALDRAIAREQSAQLPSVPWKLPRRVALIIVDAHTDKDYGWDSKEHALGLGALLGSVGQVAVSHYSFETIELFREVMARLSRERTDSGDSKPLQITTYVIDLHFNQLLDESERRFFNSVPTSLQLPSRTVDRLRRLAARQLADNVEFRRLVRDLGVSLDKPNSPACPSVAAAKDATPMPKP
ncbi:MAG TPA: patatin-like phospholipase family protein [Candidatus Limnocylindrales bacterium]|nr:patatin-like phospholipase family protein [Candidatus Limnocylindrales bacterium]